MREKNQEKLSEICHARDVLCQFCENDECEKCQVTILVNDAYNEYGDDSHDDD